MMIAFFQNKNFIFWAPGFDYKAALSAPIYSSHSQSSDTPILTPEQSRANIDKIMGRTPSTPNDPSSDAGNSSTNTSGDTSPVKVSGLFGALHTDLQNKSFETKPLSKMTPDDSTLKSQDAQKTGDFWGAAGRTAMSVASGTPNMSQSADSASLAAPVVEGGKAALAAIEAAHEDNPLMNQLKQKATPQGQSFPSNSAEDFVKKITAGPSGDAARAGVQETEGGFNKVGEALNPSSNLDAGQRVIRGVGGVVDTISGGMNTVFSPTSAAIQQVPGVRDVVSGAMGELHSATQYVGKSAIDKLGIDPNSEQAQVLQKGIDTLGQLGMLKVAGDTSEALGHQKALDAGYKALDEARASGDIGAINEATTNLEKATSAPGPTATGNIGAGILKTATDSVKGIADKFGGLFNKTEDVTKANPKQMLMERAARQAGISNNDIAALRNLTPEQESMAQEYLNHSIKAADNPINTKSVWSLPAKEISDFRDQAKIQLNTIGQNMEDAINTDLKGKTVDATPVVSAFHKVLDNLNVEIGRNGTLNFDGSDIAENPHAQTALTKILKNISNGKVIFGSLDEALAGTQLDARNLVSINRLMNSSVGKAETAGLGGNQLSAQLEPIKTAVDETVAPVSKLYSTAKAEYADLKGNLDKINDAGKFGNKGNKGFSGQQILKRSLNTDSAKAVQAFDAMKAIEENHGIKAPSDLKTKAYLANFMERLTNNEAPRSLAKQAVSAKVVDSSLNHMGIVGAAIKGSKDLAIDANYKYFSGKIPGFKDAFEKANTAHTEAVMNLIKAPDFNKLPPAAKLGILKNVGSSIPTSILAKIAAIPLPVSFPAPKSNNP